MASIVTVSRIALPNKNTSNPGLICGGEPTLSPTFCPVGSCDVIVSVWYKYPILDIKPVGDLFLIWSVSRARNAVHGAWNFLSSRPNYLVSRLHRRCAWSFFRTITETTHPRRPAHARPQIRVNPPSAPSSRGDS